MMKSSGVMNKSLIRLHVFLSRNGVGSRRKCELYIRDNMVKVNGIIVNTPGAKISENDKVFFREELIKPIKKTIYLALNKPVGYLCSISDTSGKPLVTELFKDKIKERIYHVGRLDYLSSGLIFFTNDGEFANIIMHPSFNIEKEYLIETLTNIEENNLRKYIDGIQIEGVFYRIKKYNLKKNNEVQLVLVEGKNREIRKVFSFFGIKIKRIHRIRIGNIFLGKLKPGQFRYLNNNELSWFFTKTNDK